MALAVMPYIDVPGDNTTERPLPGVHNPGTIAPRIMGRSGTLHGIDATRAVWSFGFGFNSEAARAYGVFTPDSPFPLWVLATRRTAKVKDTWRGAFINLPDDFKRVVYANSV